MMLVRVRIHDSITLPETCIVNLLPGYVMSYVCGSFEERTKFQQMHQKPGCRVCSDVRCMSKGRLPATFFNHQNTLGKDFIWLG
jgi:hypothetical protein